MLGLGNSKYAPGTVASFITCLIYILFFNLQINITFLILGTSIILIYSVYSIDEYKNSFSETDAKEIVIDEFIGQSIPVLTIYSFFEDDNVGIFIFYTFVSFVLFRLFGIYSIIILLTFIFFINYV